MRPTTGGAVATPPSTRCPATARAAPPVALVEGTDPAAGPPTCAVVACLRTPGLGCRRATGYLSRPARPVEYPCHIVSRHRIPAPHAPTPGRDEILPSYRAKVLCARLVAASGRPYTQR